MRGLRIRARAMQMSGALARRQALAALAELSVVAERQTLDELWAPTNLATATTRLGSLSATRHGDVLAHRSGEELDVLRHATDLRAQQGGRKMRDVGTCRP